jgi:hypothetical protein
MYQELEEHSLSRPEAGKFGILSTWNRKLRYPSKINRGKFAIIKVLLGKTCTMYREKSLA